MKEKALAETTALLELKKDQCDLGHGGGRMINTPDRQRAAELINETMRAGARKLKNCKELGITIRTYQRWIQDGELKSDGRPGAVRPEPEHKLTPQERETVLEVVNSEACNWPNSAGAGK